MAMPAELSMAFEPVSASVPAARRFVRRALTELGADDYEFAAAQIVSELATNAVIHARSGFTVSLALEGDLLRLAVTDSSARMPMAKNHSRQATTGRGIGMVASIAEHWGVDPLPTGKTVWVLIGAIRPVVATGLSGGSAPLLSSEWEDFPDIVLPDSPTGPTEERADGPQLMLL
jgi:hypothetical protein